VGASMIQHVLSHTTQEIRTAQTRVHSHNQPSSRSKINSITVRWVCLILVYLLISVTPVQAVLMSGITFDAGSTYITVYANATTPSVFSANATWSNTTVTATSDTTATQGVLRFTNLQPSKAYTIQVRAFNGSTTESSKPVVVQTSSSQTLKFTPNPPIPQLTSNQQISVTAQTTPFAFVTVYVDGILGQTVSAGATGSVYFDTVSLHPGQNTLSFEVISQADPSGTTIPPILYNTSVIVDTTRSEIQVTPASNTITSSFAQYTVSTTKPVTATISVRQASDSTDEKSVQTQQLQIGEQIIKVSVFEGLNEISMTFTDQAGNEDYYTQTVLVDTVPLRIEKTNLGDITPLYKSRFTVSGIVNKPDAQVRVYQVPYQYDADCTDTTQARGAISGTSISNCQGSLSAKKLLNSSYAYESTTSAQDGSFHIDVTLDYALSYSIGDSLSMNTGQSTRPVGKPTTASSLTDRDSLTAQAGRTDSYKVILVALDEQSQQFDSYAQTIEYKTCGNTADWALKPSQIYPSVINPDLLIQGLAQISFMADVDYIGSGNKNTVQFGSVSVRVNRDMSTSDTQSLTKLNLTAFSPSDILSDGSCSITSDEYSKMYVSCKLNRYPLDAKRNLSKAYDQLSQMQSVVLPLVLSFSYSYEEYNGTIRYGTFEQCLKAQIFFDKAQIIAPKKLLNATVTVLKDVVSAIDSIRKVLRPLLLTALGTCFAGQVGVFFMTARQEYVCYASDITGSVAGETTKRVFAFEKVAKYCNWDDEESCLAEMKSKAQIPDTEWTQGTDTSIYGTPVECAQKVLSRIKFQTRLQYVCDRIFCPNVPSLQSVLRKNTQLRIDEQFTTSCIGSASVTGTNPDSKNCHTEYKREWNSACIAYNPLAESQKLAKGEQLGQSRISNVFDSLNFCSANKNKETLPDAIRPDSRGPVYYQSPTVTGDKSSCYYMASDWSEEYKKSGATYESVSKSMQPAFKSPAGFDGCVATARDGTVILKPGDFNEANAESLKATQLQSVTNNAQPSQLVEVRVTKVTSAISDNPQKELFIDSEGRYYTKKGTTTSSELHEINPGTDKEGFFQIPCVTKGTDPNQAPTYEVKQSNQIDKTQCKPITNGPEKLTQNVFKETLIEPAGSFFNSLRCVCIPALDGYLATMRNTFNAVANCFSSVVYTGNTKGGACRSLLTSYICDWIFYAIKCFTRASSNYTMQGQSERQPFVHSMFALRSAAEKTKNAVSDRYGNTATYTGLIASQKMIHAVCLAAFGYDWKPEIEAGLNSGGQISAVQSDGYVFKAQRRFMGSNPLDGGKASFAYEVGFFLSAGSSVSYEVELVCSNDNSCKSDAGYDSPLCDCARGSTDGQPQTKRVIKVDGGFVEGGETVGEESNKGQIFRVITDTVRYDKAILRWRDPSNLNLSGEVRKEITLVGDKPPLDCQFSAVDLSYSCGETVATNRFGDVSFVSEGLVTNKVTYNIGDELIANVYAKADMTDIPSDRQLPKYVKVQLLDDKGKVLKSSTSDARFFSDLLQARPYVWNIMTFEGLKASGNQQQFGLSTVSSATITSSPIVDSMVTTTKNPKYAFDYGKSSSFVMGKESNTIQQFVDIGRLPFNVVEAKQLTSTLKQRVYVALFMRGGDLKARAVYQKTDEDFRSITPKLYSKDGSRASYETDRSQITAQLSVQEILVTSDRLDLDYGISIQLIPFDTTPPGGYTSVVENIKNQFKDKSCTGTPVEITGSTLPGQTIPADCFVALTAVFDFNRAKTTPVFCADPTIDTYQFTVRATLHDSRLIEPRLGASISNAQFNPAIFKKATQEQKREQKIILKCSEPNADGTQKPRLRQCSTNTVLFASDYQSDDQNSFDAGCYCETSTGDAFDLGTSISCVQSQEPSSKKAYPLCPITTDEKNPISISEPCVCVQAIKGTPVKSTNVCQPLSNDNPQQPNTCQKTIENKYICKP
jgi:hypothetical protein